MEKPSCFNCADAFIPSPRQKNQKYCGKPECQRARKTAWQRYKMAIDPDYRLNQGGKSWGDDRAAKGEAIYRYILVG